MGSFRKLLARQQRYAIVVSAGASNDGTSSVRVEWSAAQPNLAVPLPDYGLIAPSGRDAFSGVTPSGTALLVVTVDVPAGGGEFEIEVLQEGTKVDGGKLTGDARWTYAT